MFLRRKSTKGVRHPQEEEEQLAIGACRMHAAALCLLSAVLFVLSASLCMICMRTSCLKSNMLNHVYCEIKYYTHRWYFRCCLSSVWQILSTQHLHSFLVYIR